MSRFLNFLSGFLFWLIVIRILIFVSMSSLPVLLHRIGLDRLLLGIHLGEAIEEISWPLPHLFPKILVVGIGTSTHFGSMRGFILFVLGVWTGIWRLQIII